MKIVIVSNSFYPEISPRSFRTTELAKCLANLNYEVLVLTNFHEETENFESNHNIKFSFFDPKKFPIIDFKSDTKLISFFNRALNFGLNYLFTYPDIELFFLVRRTMKRVNPKADLLISIANPHQIHWGVASVINQMSIKTWVADCGDPFMGQENNSFKPPFYFKWIEKYFCRKADFITVPTQDSVTAYYKEFTAKIKIIPQGFNFDEVELFKGTLDKDMPVFAYSGSFIKNKRDPKELLEFLKTIETDYEFHIYTHPTHFNYVLPYISDNDRIKVFSYVDRKILLYELSKMDFVVNFENVGVKQTPSKLIDYAILNKPILSVKTGSLNEQHVLQFLNKNYAETFKVEHPENYRIENVVKSFLSLMSNGK